MIPTCSLREILLLIWHGTSTRPANFAASSLLWPISAWKSLITETLSASGWSSGSAVSALAGITVRFCITPCFFIDSASSVTSPRSFLGLSGCGYIFSTLIFTTSLLSITFPPFSFQISDPTFSHLPESAASLPHTLQHSAPVQTSF